MPVIQLFQRTFFFFFINLLMFNLSKFISVWVKGAQTFFKEGQIILSEHHMDDKSTQVLPKSLCLSFGKTIEFKVKSFLLFF